MDAESERRLRWLCRQFRHLRRVRPTPVHLTQHGVLLMKTNDIANVMASPQSYKLEITISGPGKENQTVVISDSDSVSDTAEARSLAQFV